MRCILRHAMTLRLFADAGSAPESIVHTAATAHVVRNPNLRSWMAHNLEEVRDGAMQLPRSLRKFSLGKDKLSQEPLESPFSLAVADRTGSPATYWDYLNQDPDDAPKGFRAKRFTEALQIANTASAIKTEDVLTSGFDWDSLGYATVVDVSNSSIHHIHHPH